VNIKDRINEYLRLTNEGLYDDIDKIKDLCAAAKIGPAGKTYLNALEKAASQYGKEGVQYQVMYILANGKWGDKDARKSLERYAKTGKF
jgi:hypothetical protein